MERFDILDICRRPLGYTRARGEKLAPGEYRNGAQIILTRKDGRVMITRRCLEKSSYPGMWEFTGGLVRTGETTRQTILRETGEEIGLSLPSKKVRLAGTLLNGGEYLDNYTARVEAEISQLTFQREEVMDARWVFPEEIARMVKSGEFVPGIWRDYEKLKHLL